MSLKTSVIIPTLNRKNDLEKTLISISKCEAKPFEVIIIDQSDNDEIETFCRNFNLLNVRYFYTNIKSSALARNIWIENLNENSDLVLFLDDDVWLKGDFFIELERFFKSGDNIKWWVANIKSPSRKINFAKRIWLFLLTFSFKQTETYVTAWWFNVMPFKNPDNLRNVEWTSWCWMFFRKSVFEEGFRFEKNFMRYSLMEDCFLSYWIQEKYANSLYFVPTIQLTHYESPASRIANKQRIYQNIVHRYLFVKKFNKSIPAYLWTMFIFSIFDSVQYRTLKIYKYYYNWLKYIFNNKTNIWNPSFDFNKFIFG